jgi:hypothetical protein
MITFRAWRVAASIAALTLPVAGQSVMFTPGGSTMTRPVALVEDPPGKICYWSDVANKRVCIGDLAGAPADPHRLCTRVMFGCLSRGPSTTQGTTGGHNNRPTLRNSRSVGRQ